MSGEHAATFVPKKNSMLRISYALVCFCWVLWCGCLGAQSTPYLIFVATDGLRVQEVFSGSDKRLMEEDPTFSAEDLDRYDHSSPEGRRQKLMPFLWGHFGAQGQIFGNREYGNRLEVTNSSCISYPGYSEMLTGFTDDRQLFLNTEKRNPHSNVLEYLSQKKKVAAFCSWELFPYILNEERAGFEVNAGFELVEREGFGPVNRLLAGCERPWKERVRPDTLTWAFAKKCLESERPEVLFISFGETDEYAHEGKYLRYLDAAHRFDSLVQELWKFIQSDPHYRDQTTLVVTTDHGRSERHWRQHLRLLKGSDAIWLGVLGPHLKPLGEVKQHMRLQQAQIAQTVASLVGEEFRCEHAVAGRIEAVFGTKDSWLASQKGVFSRFQTSLR